MSVLLCGGLNLCQSKEEVKNFFFFSPLKCEKKQSNYTDTSLLDEHRDAKITRKVVKKTVVRATHTSRLILPKKDKKKGERTALLLSSYSIWTLVVGGIIFHARIKRYVLINKETVCPLFTQALLNTQYNDVTITTAASHFIKGY